jgi:hypothetical protein
LLVNGASRRARGAGVIDIGAFCFAHFNENGIIASVAELLGAAA